MRKYIPIESLYSALDFIENSAVNGEEEKVKCITKAIRDIKFVPADVEEVCRCEHCSKSAEHPNGRWCKIHQSVVQNSDYCSWGEKR